MESKEVNIQGNHNITNFHILTKQEMKNIKDKTPEELSKQELLRMLGNNKRVIKRITSRNTKIISTIASILLLSGLFFMYNFTQRNNEVNTFNKFYRVYSEQLSINKGIEAFSLKNYSEALKHFDNDSVVIDVRLYRAISLIEGKEFHAAILELKLTNTPESEWLKALCYLRLKEHVKAKIEFEIIYKEQGLFAAQAKSILDNHYYYNNGTYN